MKVLVVFTHPSDRSFNHAILDNIVTGLEQAGHQVKIKDLYKENFNPIILQSYMIMIFPKKYKKSNNNYFGLMV